MPDGHPGDPDRDRRPKPVTLKAGSIEHFSRDPDHVVTHIASATNGRCHLRATHLSAAVVPHTTIGVIVALRYSKDDPPDFRPLSPAKACVALFGDSLDGVRMGPSVLDVLAPIAAGAAAWELAAEAAELISDIRPPLRRELVVPHRLRSSGRSAVRTVLSFLDFLHHWGTSPALQGACWPMVQGTEFELRSAHLRGASAQRHWMSAARVRTSDNSVPTVVH